METEVFENALDIYLVKFGYTSLIWTSVLFLAGGVSLYVVLCEERC